MNRTILAAGLFALTLMGALFGAHGLWPVVWFLLLLSAWTVIWLVRARRQLQVERHFPARAMNGETITVQIRLRNAGILPLPCIEMVDQVPTALSTQPRQEYITALGPRGADTLTYDLPCRQRGLFALGPLRLRLGDVLGVAERIVERDVPAPLIVYPRILPLSALGLPTRSALAVVPAIARLFEDPARIAGVRPYQAGDPVRRMHWSASARLGEPVVKQFQSGVDRETMICLDLDLRRYQVPQRYLATEQAIVVAASLLHHIVMREGLPAGLLVAGFDPTVDAVGEWPLSAHTSEEQLVAMLEVLARIQAAPETSLGSRLPEDGDVRRASSVLIVTGARFQRLAAAILGLHERGQAVGVIAVGPEEPESLAGVPVWRVWDDGDLEALA